MDDDTSQALITIISHRGNLTGPDSAHENRPSTVTRAIAAGFDVEVDVWCERGEIFLGHDGPVYPVDMDFFDAKPLWLHAKNLEAVELLLTTDLHWFWHENDRCTLTSYGHVWAYPGNVIAAGVLVQIGKPRRIRRVRGVCTDYPQLWSAGRFDA